MEFELEFYIVLL